MKQIEFKPPKGVVPEGMAEDSTFEEITTYRVKSNGNICVIMIGDAQMPGYGHKNYEKEIGDRATARSQREDGRSVKTLYQNTCPAWHDTRKISKDKWQQNLRGEGVQGSNYVVFSQPTLTFHDTKATILQKLNYGYCTGDSGGGLPSSILVDLLAYWKLEENGATTREDAHTGNLDLTPVSVPPSAAGIIGNGASISGSPGSELDSASALFGLTGEMTMAGWMKFTSLVSIPQYLVGKQNMNVAASGFPTDGYMLYLNSSGKLTFWQGNGVTTATVSSTATIVVGVWYYVVAGFDGGQIFIQVNNATRTYASGLVPTVGSVNFEFGGQRGNTGAGGLFGAQAIMDEWGVWIRALTPADAVHLYNGGTGRTYPFS